MWFSKRDLKWVLLIILVITMISQTKVIEGNIDNQSVDQEDINEYSYETDITTIKLDMIPDGGAAWGTYGVLMNAVDERVRVEFYLTARVDDSRNIVITFCHRANNAGVIDGILSIDKLEYDGTVDLTVIENSINWDFTLTDGSGSITTQYTLVASDVEALKGYSIIYQNKEAATDNYMKSIQIEYYKKCDASNPM